MAAPKFDFDQKLGPFYDNHGPEIVPAGFEESLALLGETLGSYQVVTSEPSLQGDMAITHYDLTKYIQDDWDRVNKNDPNDPPRRGFFISGRSASAAAGRAAEEILLAKLLWRFETETIKAEEVLGFYSAVDAGIIKRPKGSASDDLVVKLSDGSLMLVESKSSFRASPDKYVAAAAKQLAATVGVNVEISRVALALVDLTRHLLRLAIVGRTPFLGDPEGAIRAALPTNQEVAAKYAHEFAALSNLLTSEALGMWADRTDIIDSSDFAAKLRAEAWRRTG